MKRNAVFGSSILLLLSAFLAGCGNMNTVIAKNAAYGLDAFVGSRNLDDGAAISAADSIRPSFTSEVEGDPDVTGLKVYLETADGKAAASDVVYRLSAEGSPRGVGEEPVLVPRFSGELPAFALPADLAVGRYVLVMRVFGEDGVLFERRRSIYYLADATFNLGRVVSYPPGTGPSATAPVFPTETNLLLHAEIEADDRLDPYVAWYFGTKLIGMGRLKDGGNQILWKTPAREGFHTVRVEVYPEPPLDLKSPDLIGASAELTVATSLTAAVPGLPGAAADYARLYRFLGDLSDSADAQDAARVFARTNGVAPAWARIGDSYGLSVGPGEQYQLDLPLVPVRAGGLDPARVSTRAALSARGLIWRASFVGISGAEALSAELSIADGLLQLRLGDDQGGRTASAALPAGLAADEAVLIEVSLSASYPTATAVLSVNASGSAAVSIPFSTALMGTGSVRLGGLANSGSAENAAPPRTAVIDELGVASAPETDTSVFEN